MRVTLAAMALAGLACQSPRAIDSTHLECKPFEIEHAPALRTDFPNPSAPEWPREFGTSLISPS